MNIFIYRCQKNGLESNLHCEFKDARINSFSSLNFDLRNWKSRGRKYKALFVMQI